MAKKILCIIDYLGSGGAQRQIVNLAVEFKKSGHDISFLTYHNKNDFYRLTLEDNNIPIACIAESNYIKRMIKMRKYIRHGKYDVILSFLAAANFICEISTFPYHKWKLIVGERSANPHLLISWKLRLFRYFHIFANQVVANSQTNIELVRQVNSFLSKKKCKVIYNMIDLAKWMPSDSFTFRKNELFTIVVLASHRHLKNLNGFIDAVLLLTKEEQSELRIQWYGNILDNSFDLGIIKIKENGIEDIFQFENATHNILDCMQQADAVGLFSFYEGFPNAICEGMACGKPVLCSNISDIPLLITEKKLIFDPNDVFSISKTLRFLLSLNADELNEIGKKNRTMAEQYFDKEAIVSKYITLFNA
ncbi:4-N-acetyl-D-galactosaminyltransferase [termite gut metagenome]|uniref:4-N-acetyl-D-galactosaminyltransferase n=1 Tax=termite gut metagenome TaxID=433724 RepID=A0A5J4SQ05_9ZZZZ